MSATTLPENGTSTWKLDPSHSNAEFAVKHMMIATVKGTFADVSGEVALDEQNPRRSRVSVQIPTSTVDTREAKRDGHLKSGDFFDVEKYPTMAFESTAVEPVGDGQFRVTGDLTIRDVTKPVVLEVVEEGRGRDPWGGERVGYSATTKINREDFGLTWNVALETGGVLVSKDVKIQLDVQAVKA